MQRDLATTMALIAELVSAAGQSRAQNYPDRSIRTILPFPPGGVADAVARIVGQKLSNGLTQNAIIENRPGASGTLGASVVAKAAPDGYTLLITTGDFITMPAIMPTLSFDPYKELLPIAMLAVAPLILVINSGSGINSVQDVIDAARARPASSPTRPRHWYCQSPRCGKFGT